MQISKRRSFTALCADFEDDNPRARRPLLEGTESATTATFRDGNGTTRATDLSRFWLNLYNTLAVRGRS